MTQTDQPTTPQSSRTRAATAASVLVRRRKRQERLAAELRTFGWTCTPPPEPVDGGR